MKGARPRTKAARSRSRRSQWRSSRQFPARLREAIGAHGAPGTACPGCFPLSLDGFVTPPRQSPRRSPRLKGPRPGPPWQIEANLSADGKVLTAAHVVQTSDRILSRSGGFEGLGFAVTSNMAKKLLLERAIFWTGVDAVLLSEDLARLFNLPQPAGLLIQRIAEGSPAVEDIEVSADAASFDRIYGYLTNLKPGDMVAVSVLRDGKVVTLSGRAQRL